MEIFEFNAKVVGAMKKEFGENCRIEVKEIKKNNGVVLHGLLIITDERSMIPTIYLDPFWEAYEGGVTFSEIVRRLVEIYCSETRKKSVDMDFFKDFPKVKNRICYRLINREANKELLEEIPHIDFLDLAICFFYSYSSAELGEGSILIHNSHLPLWQTNVPELMKLAEKNTPRLYPSRLYSMEEMLRDLFRQQPGPAPDVEDFRELLETVTMSVLSNKQKVFGAVCMLYEENLAKLAERCGTSFYILPSSIHEVILLPDTGRDTPQDLKEMIRDVNTTQVAPEEVLSYNLYYFDIHEKKVKLIF